MPEGPLDLVGDVHGEYEALVALLGHLGYDRAGRHPQGRFLVFVGDLGDRGPNSPGVIALVRRLVREGRAECLLGNHELNLLRGDRKDGNDWFWNEDAPADRKYHPWATLPGRGESPERAAVRGFLLRRPLVAHRADLRVVHAAWHPGALAQLRLLPSGRDLLWQFEALDLLIAKKLHERGLASRHAQEMLIWGPRMQDPVASMPALPAVAAADELRQMAHPVRVLTSGVERAAEKPFFTSGRWRFVQRHPWWMDYDDEVPVVTGHYWRSFQPLDRAGLGKSGPDLFAGVHPLSWLGPRRRVFCVDYSAGALYRRRQPGHEAAGGSATGALAALRWPERTLMTHEGRSAPTRGF
ncbi:metallophosphoesterase [Ideonella sp. TBM-1]|uniref:Metallophosphoesterase n=1 Tax=Ideonella livida TaxID=2707176 RepID=A0A7C9TM54_9BURK|nr:metallophosphoesterase [Ideonella livida]